MTLRTSPLYEHGVYGRRSADSGRLRTISPPRTRLLLGFGRCFFRSPGSFPLGSHSSLLFPILLSMVVQRGGDLSFICENSCINSQRAFCITLQFSWSPHTHHTEIVLRRALRQALGHPCVSVMRQTSRSVLGALRALVPSERAFSVRMQIAWRTLAVVVVSWTLKDSPH